MQNSLGQRLRAAREARDMSLQDAAHHTRIPAVRLQLMEDDNLAAFGSMAYAKSFVKGYSQFLNVDAGDVLDSLPRPLFGGAADYRHLTENFGEWVGKRRQEPRSHPRPAAWTQNYGNPLMALAGIFVVLVLVTAVWGSHLLDWQKGGKAAVGEPAKAEAAADETQKLQPGENPDDVNGKPQVEIIMRAAPVSLPPPIDPRKPLPATTPNPTVKRPTEIIE